jgi:hypothetical protein
VQGFDPDFPKCPRRIFIDEDNVIAVGKVDCSSAGCAVLLAGHGWMDLVCSVEEALKLFERRE